MADKKTLEERLKISEKELSNGKTALLIADPEEMIEGIVLRGKKQVGPERLALSVNEKYKIQAELDFANELLNMHRYFDGLRDSVKRKEKITEKVIEESLVYLAEGIGALYVGFKLNEQLKTENKLDPKYANFDVSEVIHSKEGYKPLNGKRKLFFGNFREKNPRFEIDFEKSKNSYYENIGEEAEQIATNRPISGSGFTLYLQPGNDVIGAIQAIQTKKIGKKEGKFIGEWVNLADTFLSDMLNIKIEAEHDVFEENPEEPIKQETDSDRVKRTFGLSVEDLTNSFVGTDFNKRGNIENKVDEQKFWKFYKNDSYLDKNYGAIRSDMITFFHGFKEIRVDGEHPGEKLEQKKFEKGKKLLTKIYRERPEFDIIQEEADKDINEAVSCMKLLDALYTRFEDTITKDFVLDDTRAVDPETLKTASIFTAGFSKAVRYMPQADKIPRIIGIRERNDIKEMTSYLSGLIEIPELAGEISYFGEPLVNKYKKQSLLGSTIIEISNKINPDKESHFAIDLIEKVMTYVERVQALNLSDEEENKILSSEEKIDKVIFDMYEESIKTKNNTKYVDEKAITATRMIEKLVSPQGTAVYDSFRQKYPKPE